MASVGPWTLVHQHWYLFGSDTLGTQDIRMTRFNQYFVITKSDTVDFPQGMCDALYVGGAGIVQVVAQDGTVVPFTAVAGEILPVQAKRVNSTDTTATLMNALYQR
jgi:hypothetical protein